MNMFIFGYPTPPATAAAISDRPTVAINCNVHGNEASGRESCFTQARQLALSTDPAITGLLSRMTILMIPSINADGRAANTRGNTTGQDLNRDHALIEQNETKGYAAMLRDYTPDVALDNHEGDSEDLPILSARHLNVYEPLFEEGKYMVNTWMYGAAAQSGWWMGPYSTGGDSHEGILRNTQSLKHTVSMLGEARAAPGATRPAEGGSNQPANRLRKVYAHLWENWEVVRYFDARMTQIRAVNAASEAAALSPATGRTVLRGSYPWPLVPSVGENPNDQPDVDTPLASRILDPAPCGYFIPESEYTAPRVDPDDETNNFGTVAQRFAFHGIQVQPRTGGVFVPLRQRLRGLIAPLLDSEAVLPMIETAQRVFCFPGDVGGTVPATLSLTLGAPANFGAVHARRRADVQREHHRQRDLDRRRRDAVGDRSERPEPGPPGQRQLLPAAAAQGSGLQPAVDDQDVQRTGLQRPGDDQLRAVHRRQRRVAHRDLLEDADVHAVDDEPVGLSAGG